MSNQVCIIIPYFGKWPVYFQLFLASCQHNENLDFIFFTDLKKPSYSPQNVRFFNIKFSWFDKQFQEKLHVDSNITAPYKLCDIKPFYGFLFESHIQDYSFWGFCDIDLILGRTSAFIDDDLLKKYDVISFRKEWMSGALALFRNNTFINTLFLKNNDYVRVLQDANYLGYDETSLEWSLYRQNDNILGLSQSISNLTRIVKEAEEEGFLKAHFHTLIKESIPSGSFVIWDDGKIKCDDKEYLLYHYITEKKRFSFSYPNWQKVPEKYYISQTGFYQKDEYCGFKYGYLDKTRKLRGVMRKTMYYFSRSMQEIRKLL